MNAQELRAKEAQQFLQVIKSPQDVASFDCYDCAGAAKLPLPLACYPRMWLCKTCGNKRCPRAKNHANACSASNELGQKGACTNESTR